MELPLPNMQQDRPSDLSSGSTVDARNNATARNDSRGLRRGNNGDQGNDAEQRGVNGHASILCGTPLLDRSRRGPVTGTLSQTARDARSAGGTADALTREQDGDVRPEADRACVVGPREEHDGPTCGICGQDDHDGDDADNSHDAFLWTACPHPHAFHRYCLNRDRETHARERGHDDNGNPRAIPVPDVQDDTPRRRPHHAGRPGGKLRATTGTVAKRPAR